MTSEPVLTARPRNRLELVALLACAIVAVGVAALAFGLGGLRGIAYVLLYVAATVPGWPIGFALFGRRHAAGWVTGALFGYVMTALGIWAVVSLGAATLPAFAVQWAVQFTAAWWWGIGRHEQPLLALPRWNAAATVSLAAVLVLVLALVSLPYLHVGARRPDGTRSYRAYFTADFLWHTALTAELSRLELPPRDPYSAEHPLHYYWTYFQLPAAVIGSLPTVFRGVEPWLLINAMCTGLLFMSMVFVGTWTAVPSAVAAAGAVALALLAASAEGSYAMWRLWQDGKELGGVRNLNIDAITMWWFNGLSVDGLPRALWYNPQHASACALGLIALIVAGSTDARPRQAAVWLAGFALAGATAFSPFLGGAFCLTFGLAVLLAGLADPHTLPVRVARHAVAAIPVALAVAWCSTNAMLSGTGTLIHVGFIAQARHAPLITMALALGPLMVPAILGLFFGARTRPIPQWPLSGALVGTLLFYLVSLPGVDPYWVGWRAGQVLLVTLPALAARFFGAGGPRSLMRRAAIACGACCVLVGLPTTAIDAYNAQDITNFRTDPGFSWTITLSPGQQTALEWIRTHTPRDAIVQMDVDSRKRETWSLVPTFAGRAMAAGLPISLVEMPYHLIGARRVHDIYRMDDVGLAWRMLRSSGIDYLYVGDVERANHPATSLAKFDSRLDLFRAAFHNDDVTVYRVLPNPDISLTPPQS